MTVIALSGDFSVGEKWLKDTIIKYEKVDDVFRREFLSGVIFTGSSQIDVTAGATKLLESMGTEWIELVDTASSAFNPPPGPYYVWDKQLFEIWKLYDDCQGAFLTSLVPGPNG